jgi:broad specificity phosphatase PhoE
MRRVILIRHGESAINAANKTQRYLCGQIETPLTDFGRQQAQTVGQTLARQVDFGIAHSISSKLGRARETCEIILQQFASHAKQPTLLVPNAAFNERSLGQFEGQLEEDVFRQFPQYRDDPQFCRFREDFIQKAPGGENLGEVTQRAWSGFEVTFSQTTGNLLIVSHFNTIKCLIGRALRLTQAEILQIDIPNATPLVLLAANHQFQLEGDLPVRQATKPH